MTASFIALATALSLPFLGAQDVQRQHQRIGAWTLTVTHERFAGAVKCRLTTNRVGYERQALVMRLPAQVNTASALYRIDDGDPRPAAGDAMELASLGFALTRDDLDNPSGGLVRVPARLLAEASRVGVQTRPGGPVFRFKVAGLQAALDAARAAGCVEASFR